MFIDSHCHINLLDLEKCGGNVDAVLAAAKQNKVDKMLCVATELEHFPEVLAIAEAYDNVYASVGVHPNEEAGEDPSVEKLVKLADHKKIIAIGETGLDYFRSEGDLTWQQDRFRRHIAAAKESGKPLIIHTRDAREDTIKILQEENAKEIGGVMHCFTETWEMAEQAMAMNFYISFSGIVTFKNAKALQDVARRVPSDRYLIETDCPYLAPAPHRGKQNEPAFVKHVAEFMAELRGVTIADIARESTENFYRCFKV
jgi:TatD DNase family protein